MSATTAPINWRKTKRSMANANCVEVAAIDHRGVSWIRP